MPRGQGIAIPTNAPGWLASVIDAVQQYVGEQMRQPVFFPHYTSTDYPTASKWPYCGIYFTTTSKPAWSDGAVWRYSDGTAAP